MLILAIETSCDDTCLAVLEIKAVNYSHAKILANFVSSQIKIHAPFAGVVPHLAARAHYRNLPILLEKVLTKIDPKKIDLIAVTIGPGLEPSLWAGIRFARLLSLGLKKPIVGVNHLEGHIAANFIDKTWSPAFRQRQKGLHLVQSHPKGWSLFPAICLIVSGGHTQLILMRDFGRYKILGQTRDDAAGEAFDKVAKLLNLGYPGGPAISQSAKKGNPNAFDLPRPMIHSKDYDFSFSGLKTAVLYLIKKLEAARNSRVLKSHISSPSIPHFFISDLAASFQQAVVDVLVSKTIRAAKEYQVKSVMLTGGVAANLQLRQQMRETIKSQIPNSQFLVPTVKFCTDNGAMIALAGWWQYLKKGPDKLEKIVAKANFKL